MSGGWRWLIALVVIAGLVPVLPVGVVVADDATVGGLCDEAAFDTALATALTGGGGTITFDCGGATTITFTSLKTITAGNTVVIDGAKLITLDGADATRMFDVAADATLELRNIAINNGNDASDEGFGDPGGAINVRGTLRVLDSSFESNDGGSEGGAIDLDGGSAEVIRTTFTNNSALYGGAIDGDPGTLVVTESTFNDNEATYGGALFIGVDVTATINESSFTLNKATAYAGGAIYSDGRLEIGKTTFEENSAGEYGGAIDNGGAGSTEITDSEFIDNTTVNGNGGAIDNDAPLTITGSSFTGNNAFNTGGAIWTDDSDVTISDSSFAGNYTAEGDKQHDGGALFVDGDTGLVTITNVDFVGNKAFRDGGAIASRGGTLEISESLFEANEALSGDGGALDPDTGITSITDSYFVANEANEDGGAIDYDDVNDVDDSLTITRSTFYHNSAGEDGSALHLDGHLATIETSTFSENRSNGVDGGAIYSEDGQTTISNSTITANEVRDGASGIVGDGGTLTLLNTIVADNFGDDCDGPITSDGYNLDSDGTCSLDASTDISSGDADLGPLADNGGLTLTHLPGWGSDAVDNGPSTCTSPDQRGVARPNGPACDIGAVELPPSVMLCANRYTGQLSVSAANGSCPAGSVTLTLPSPTPTTLCINRYTGALTWSPRGTCGTGFRVHVLPDDGPLNYCQSLFTGQLRYTANGTCGAYERPGMIPAA